jgi:predicted DNA-binding transcriptional regulator YafY
MSNNRIVIIDYTNHRGERRERRIVPFGLRFGYSNHHPGEQWLLEAYDCDKEAARTFAMKDVHSWRAL